MATDSSNRDEAQEIVGEFRQGAWTHASDPGEIEPAPRLRTRDGM